MMKQREQLDVDLIEVIAQARAEERAAVVTWLREYGSGAWLENGGMSLVCLDEIADKFERGEHRHEEER